MVQSKSFCKLAGNGLQLPEGGDLHHKCLLNALQIVYQQNCHRSTEPPLAPNPCYSQWLLPSVLANHCQY